MALEVWARHVVALKLRTTIKESMELNEIIPLVVIMGALEVCTGIGLWRTSHGTLYLAPDTMICGSKESSP